MIISGMASSWGGQGVFSRWNEEKKVMSRRSRKRFTHCDDHRSRKADPQKSN